MNPLGVDKVICLSLDLRKDMWRKLETQCLEKGWDFKPFICGGGGDRGLDPELTYDLIDSDELPVRYENSTNYPTWFTRPNAYRAFKAHKAMIEFSLEKDYESVAFLEDDVGFFPDFDDKIIEADNNMPREWEMVYVGNFLNKLRRQYYVSENIVQVYGNCAGFHFTCIKKSVLERLYRFLPLGPIDWMCQHYIQNNTMCYAINPPLVRQLGGHSFVEGHFLGRREEDNYQ